MKHPVYGFEKPYFENIKAELSGLCDEAYYDAFDNLVFVKNKENSDKTVLIGCYASENAFLVSDIKEDGTVDAVPLIKPDNTITNERIIAKNKSGFIRKKEEAFFLDFGFDNKKSAEKLIKCGDTLFIKPNYEKTGNFCFSNEKAFALKNILTELLKNDYPYKIIFALFREKSKGAYALGKNLKTDYAFFLTLSEEIKERLSYLKKEKSYISDFSTNALPCHISENVLSYADSYYLAGGSPKATGLAIKCENLGNGTFKLNKHIITELSKFLKVKL